MATYTPPDPRHEMQQNLLFLREYAKRSIVEEDPSLAVLADVKEAIIDEVWQTRESLKLTERDLVVLLLKGVLPQSC
jgi:hypothetical protein